MCGNEDYEEFKRVYQEGLASEREVIVWLAKTYVLNGNVVRLSSEEENIFEDIDCFVDDVPVSIKTQHSAASKGCLVFELKVLLADGRWVGGWFKTGKPKVYIFRVNDTLFFAYKNAIEKFVRKNGWLGTTALTAKSRSLQRFHRHKDARLGLLRISDIFGKVLFHLGDL